MSYRTILVHLDYEGSSAGRIQLARAMADQFDARLIGFGVAQFNPLIWADGNGIVDAELIELERRDVELRLEAMEKEFRDLAGSRVEGCSVEFGFPTARLVDEARKADLIVSGSPKGAHTGDRYKAVDLGAFVMGAGRPLLLAAEGADVLRGERVVVAWKDTREARRAVLDALPLLHRAKAVVVVTIAEENQPQGAASANDVVHHLERHDIKARAETVAAGASGAAEELVSAARRLDADLIVSGAYGHGRLREWAFGGVTRSLLGTTSINRLLSN